MVLSSKAYFKMCFEVQNIRLPFLCDPLLLGTKVPNDMQSSELYVWVIFKLVEVIHITCNMGAHHLSDMCTLRPVTFKLRPCISGKSLMPMLQLL